MNADGRSKSVRHSLAAFSRWSRTDPAERAANSSRIAKIGAAKRAAERQAAGIPAPRRRANDAPLPSREELEPYLAAVDAEPRKQPLSYDQRYREAVLRLRLDIAAQTLEALKRARP